MLNADRSLLIKSAVLCQQRGNVVSLVMPSRSRDGEGDRADWFGRGNIVALPLLVRGRARSLVIA